MARKFEAKPAEREKLKFVGMFTGADGSGKTASALMIMKGLAQAKYPEMDDTSDEFWAKIGLADTEHNRAKVYSNQTINGHYLGKFMHIDFTPPYDVDSYIAVVNHLKSIGCEFIILDSLTPAWEDTGGILEVHNKMGGTFQTWNKVNPIVKKFYRAVTADREAHIIATVRAKIKYEMETSETGKLGVSKIGLKPIMRDNFEYEVLSTVHFNMEHKSTVLKDITHIIPSGVFIEPKAGRDLYDFLEMGVDMNAVRELELTEIKLAINDILENVKPAHKQAVDSLMFQIKRQAKGKYGTEIWSKLPIASLTSIKENLEGITNE